MGILNGTIFYANVLATNRQFFIPVDHPTFPNVFIGWLNLDVGFDMCFFKGLNAYAKVWLQIAFPVYIIIIVVAVIIASHYSRRFATLIARKNPVATLATLILLSYAKLLHSTIGMLSYAILRYTPLDERDSFTKVVWLRDGSVPYLEGAHIPLFIIAVIIVVLGLIYTSLLLFWQCLAKFSNKALFLWVKNTKLTSFIDAYHAPYTARNRYWTGLLLLARVILYLTAAINVSSEPSVNLLAILLVIGCISLLHAYSGISIYKKWPLNVLAIAYAFITIQFMIFAFSLFHHIMLEYHILDKVKQSKWYKTQFCRNLIIPLLDNEIQYTAPSQEVTYSEVTIVHPEIQYTTGVDSEREGLSLLLSTENSRV